MVFFLSFHHSSPHQMNVSVAWRFLLGTRKKRYPNKKKEEWFYIVPFIKGAQNTCGWKIELSCVLHFIDWTISCSVAHTCIKSFQTHQIEIEHSYMPKSILLLWNRHWATGKTLNNNHQMQFHFLPRNFSFFVWFLRNICT